MYENDLKEKVDAYFASCKENDEMPSPAGLAKWLEVGIDTLERWRDEESVLVPIKTAFLKIHADLASGLQKGTISPAAAIFLLKNWFGYTG